MQSRKITFRRITKPKGKDFERLWKIYEECFPIRDERETKAHLEEYAGACSSSEKGRYAEHFLLSVDVDGSPAGGAIFDYVEGKICGKTAGFGTGFYIFIAKEHRGKGLGRLTQEKHLDILKKAVDKKG